MKLVSYNGTAINNGTTFTATLQPGGHGIPAVSANMANRSLAWPILSGVSRRERTLDIQVVIVDVANKRTHQATLDSLFDTDDESPHQLVIEDDGGSNDRYVMAKVVQLGHVPEGNGLIFQVSLVVSGDIRWRKTTQNTNTFSVTASGQTKQVTNGGDDVAYPIITITPTSSKTGGYAYKRFVPIQWNTAYSGVNYPIRIGPFDTATLVSGGKMQADGDDLRVLVDGVQHNRWLVSMNSATTYIWFCANWQPSQEGTISAAIGSGDTVEVITLNEDISDWPTEGLIYMPTAGEVFTYTGKDNGSRTFTGVTRAVRGTTAQNHANGATAHWLQHDIHLLYGNSTVTSADLAGYFGLVPAFDYANSSNAQHDYLYFGHEVGGVQQYSAAWHHGARLDLSRSWHCYTADQYPADMHTSPWDYLGMAIIEFKDFAEVAYWTLDNPCGIDNVNWVDGERYWSTYSNNFLFHAGNWPRGARWWNYHYNLVASGMATQDSWVAWSNNSAVDPSNTIMCSLWYFGENYIQVNRVVVDLVDTPTVTILGEVGSYTLDLELHNTTTDEKIFVAVEMGLNEDLVLTIEDRTAINQADGSSQYQAISTWANTPTRFWMTLTPGVNDIVFTDVGTVAVTLDVDFEERVRA